MLEQWQLHRGMPPLNVLDCGAKLAPLQPKTRPSGWFIVVKYFVNIFFNDAVLSTMPDAGYSRVSTEL